MQDPRSSSAMRSTLQYLLMSDMPSDHKAVLLEALTQAMRTCEDEPPARQNLQPAEQWRADETAQLQSLAEGKVAKSWQHADEALMHIAAQLHRQPRDVRIKATELGFGACVDYGVARANAPR